MSNHYLRFSTLDAPPLRHAVTTRGSRGPNDGPYNDFNLAFHVDDDSAHVRANRMRLATDLGFEITMLHAAQQTHGTAAEIVTASQPARGALDWETACPETDALVTRDAVTPLLILVADCAPILLVDHEAHVLAVVHAGWRCATARIASQTVARMEALGASATNIRAGIGPHLCPQCFEVGDEVADFAELVAPAAVVRTLAKPHLNLETLLRADLASVGVEAVETMPHCPRCQSGTFFSHRAQNGVAGRFGLIAWWAE